MCWISGNFISFWRHAFFMENRSKKVTHVLDLHFYGISFPTCSVDICSVVVFVAPTWVSKSLKSTFYLQGSGLYIHNRDQHWFSKGRQQPFDGTSPGTETANLAETISSRLTIKSSWLSSFFSDPVAFAASRDFWAESSATKESSYGRFYGCCSSFPRC